MKDKHKINYALIISFLILILVIIYSIYVVIKMHNNENFILLMINAAVLLLISVFAIINQFRMKAKKSQFTLLNSFTAIIFAICTFIVVNNTTTVALEDSIPNFVGKNITEALAWANENKIEIDQIYEFSDNYDEYIIFNQSIEAGTFVKDINNLTITISSGYNYDKKVIIPSYVGQNIEMFLTNMDSLHLNNVKIKYEINDNYEKDIIISQNMTGEIRRNDAINIYVSLGKKDNLTDVTMIDLKQSNLFESILFLEKNGINYEIKEEFSNEKVNMVINQSIEAGGTVKPLSEKVIITISKGNKIIVPDLLNMSVDQVIAWISDNNLKIAFSDAYDAKIEVGKIISANYKEDDVIEEGTTVKIVTSKGALKMRKFASLNEFRTWANTYNILYNETYEFNNTVAKGSIVSFSLEENDLIDIKNEIVVTISNGKPITIPNFVGKTKTEILASCNNLNCQFSYGNYSSTAKDAALSQNKKAGSTVVSGTTVSISLSKGTAKTFTIELYESLIMGNGNPSYNNTVKSLKKYFADNYPDVTFNFKSTNKSNDYYNSGFIHENSQIRDGSKVTQGKTYTVLITDFN